MSTIFYFIVLEVKNVNQVVRATLPLKPTSKNVSLPHSKVQWLHLLVCGCIISMFVFLSVALLSVGFCVSTWNSLRAFLSFFAGGGVPGIEHRTSHLPGRHYARWAKSPASNSILIKMSVIHNTLRPHLNLVYDFNLINYIFNDTIFK